MTNKMLLLALMAALSFGATAATVDSSSIVEQELERQREEAKGQLLNSLYSAYNTMEDDDTLIFYCTGDQSKTVSAISGLALRDKSFDPLAFVTLTVERIERLCLPTGGMSL